MPDKHEVGGSSPLGPTTRSKIELETNLIKRKRLFSSETRDKLIRWFESTWAYHLLTRVRNGDNYKPFNGGVAQLGEHLPCKQGVMGSNPIISTRNP